MLRSFLLAITALLLLQRAARAADPAGLWQSETGKSRYQVRHCGQGICVKIVWIVEGPEVRDASNPDPAKRGRRVMGIDITSEFRADGPNRWSGGLYNFKNGQTYAGYAELLGENKLRVTGCALRILCISQTLTRLP